MKCIRNPNHCNQYLCQNMNRVPPSASEVCSTELYLFAARSCYKEYGESSVSFVES
jgi:hypothetical protein